MFQAPLVFIVASWGQLRLVAPGVLPFGLRTVLLHTRSILLSSRLDSFAVQLHFPHLLACFLKNLLLIHARCIPTVLDQVLRSSPVPLLAQEHCWLKRTVGLKLGFAMTTMTPTRPSQRRRLTSPLHEMDGTDEEEEIPETPVESELVASPLTSASLAQIVRDEVRHGMNTLEQQMTQLSVSVTARLDSVEHSLKDHDIKIAKLEHVITSNSSTPRSNTNVEQLEKHDCELAALKLQLDALKHGVADRNPDVQKTLVLGGLQALGSLHEATQWLTQKLQEMNGPTNVGTYMKAAAFDGLLFAKFRSTYMNVTRRWLCSGVPTYKLVTVGSGQQRTFLCQFVLANCSC